MTKVEAKLYLESLDILEGFIKDSDSVISTTLCFQLLKGIEAFKKDITENSENENSDYYKIISVAKRNVLVVKNFGFNEYNIEMIYKRKRFLRSFDSEQKRDVAFEKLNDDKSLMEIFPDWLKNLNEFHKLLFNE